MLIAKNFKWAEWLHYRFMCSISQLGSECFLTIIVLISTWFPFHSSLQLPPAFTTTLSSPPPSLLASLSKVDFTFSKSRHCELRPPSASLCSAQNPFLCSGSSHHFSFWSRSGKSPEHHRGSALHPLKDKQANVWSGTQVLTPTSFQPQASANLSVPQFHHLQNGGNKIIPNYKTFINSSYLGKTLKTMPGT